MNTQTKKVYLPNGRYRAKLESTGQHQYLNEDGKNKTIWYFNWKVTEGQYKDAQFSTSLWPDSSKAMGLYKYIMEIMGCDPENTSCSDPNVLLNLECLVTIMRTKQNYHSAIKYEPVDAQ